MIYLDNNATTRLHPEVREAMAPYLDEEYGNPSSLHSHGKRARRAVDAAREQVATLIQARPSEILFTGSGSEATSTALHAALECLGSDTALITSTVEHSATARACSYYESKGHPCFQIQVDGQGQPDLDQLDEVLARNSPALVTFIWANNETGVLSPVQDLAEVCARHGALLHLDAVQACGKVPISLGQIPAHFVSLSAHKFHGPKGTGALFARATVPFLPLIHGGGQEDGRRSGTENVSGIVGMGKAAEIVSLSAMEDIATLRDRLEREIQRLSGTVEINGDPENRLPNTSNLAFGGIDAEALLIVLDHLGVCASPGSACGSAARNPSAVLTAMGYEEARVKSSVRFSLSRFTTDAEIKESVARIGKALARVTDVMPSSGSPVVRKS